MQGNVLEYRAVGFVRKKNILVDHLTAHGLGYFGRAGFVAFGVMVENIEHAFAGGPSALEHLIQAMQPRHRLVKEHQIKQEPNQLAGGHSAGYHGLAAEPQH